MTKTLHEILNGIHEITDTHVVKIPSNLTTKRRLLEILNKGLKCPEGYGTNWDAFDETITDLSWLEPKNILLRHEDFPKLDERDFAIYMTTLRDAIEFWQVDGKKNLFVLFGR